jgi:hypothetical protein
VAFVRGGKNVDDAQDLLVIIRGLTNALQALASAMQYQQNALQSIEERMQVLENE